MMPRLLLLALVLLPALTAQDTKPKPIDRNGFFEAVRLGGLKPEELIAILGEFGVDFRLQPEDEKELARLKVDQRLIEAVRRNYRGPSDMLPPVELPEGPPLTRAQVVLALQAGVDPAVVVDLIKKRGAAFLVDREAAAEILAAGGNKLVVGAAVVNLQEGAVPPKPATPKTQPAKLAPRGLTAGPAAPERIRVPGPEQARKLVRQTAPEYPALATRMNVQGKVILDVHIGTGGDVTAVKVLSGHSMLSASAAEAVRTWQYQPTLVNGVPVEVSTEVEVTFSLKK